jgi:hypothetical protein
MTTAKKTAAKKATAKKAPAKKAPAKKKAAPKKAASSSKAAVKPKKFVDTNKFFEEIAAKQIAEHAEKIELLVDSIPAQITVDSRGLKNWLRKLFKSASK